MDKSLILEDSNKHVYNIIVSQSMDKSLISEDFNKLVYNTIVSHSIWIKI